MIELKNAFETPSHNEHLNRKVNMGKACDCDGKNFINIHGWMVMKLGLIRIRDSNNKGNVKIQH
ncbi:MAG: hypothetical protein J1F14_05110 [Treponema sp.]|nr:hypothetical protein [Treponema sp.]